MKFKIRVITGQSGSLAPGVQRHLGSEPGRTEPPNPAWAVESDTPGDLEPRDREGRNGFISRSGPSAWTVPIRPAYRPWGINE